LQKYEEALHRNFEGIDSKAYNALVHEFNICKDPVRRSGLADRLEQHIKKYDAWAAEQKKCRKKSDMLEQVYKQIEIEREKEERARKNIG